MGAKIAAVYPLQVDTGGAVTLKLRLPDLEPLEGMETGAGKVGGFVSAGAQERAEGVPGTNDFGGGYEDVFVTRQKEAEEFYATRIPKELSEDAKAVMRQSFSGMLWSKQFYHYDVRTGL